MIKKGDFIEIEYTGMTDDKLVFDTTDEALAKEQNIHHSKTEYGPAIVCIGERHLIEGLDEQIAGKEPGEHTISLSPEQAFGSKDPKMIQLVATSKFKKQGINPEAGLQLVIDNMIGTVKAVTGGRTIVDFNHPLAGKNIVYEINIKRIIADKKEKAKALLKLEFKIRDNNAEFKGNTLVIKSGKPVPEEVKTHVSHRVKDLTGVEEVEFKAEKKAEKKEPEKESKEKGE